MIQMIYIVQIIVIDVIDTVILCIIDKIFGDYSYQVLGDIELDTARKCIQSDIHQQKRWNKIRKDSVILCGYYVVD